MLVEDKLRKRSPFYLTEETWQKLLKEAKLVYKIPAFRITVGGESVVVLKFKDWLEIGGYPTMVRTISDHKGLNVHVKNKKPRPPDVIEHIWRGRRLAFVSWGLFEEVNNSYMEAL